MAPMQYIKKMIDGYVGMFEEHKKKNVQSTIDKGAQPESDTPDLMDADCLTKHQSLAGNAQ
jgi:hypothetical protein